MKVDVKDLTPAALDSAQQGTVKFIAKGSVLRYIEVTNIKRNYILGFGKCHCGVSNSFISRIWLKIRSTSTF
jgi:hypothetical protein